MAEELDYILENIRSEGPVLCPDLAPLRSLIDSLFGFMPYHVAKRSTILLQDRLLNGDDWLLLQAAHMAGHPGRIYESYHNIVLLAKLKQMTSRAEQERKSQDRSLLMSESLMKKRQKAGISTPHLKMKSALERCWWNGFPSVCPMSNRTKWISCTIESRPWPSCCIDQICHPGLEFADALATFLTSARALSAWSINSPRNRLNCLHLRRLRRSSNVFKGLCSALYSRWHTILRSAFCSFAEPFGCTRIYQLITLPSFTISYRQLSETRLDLTTL